MPTIQRLILSLATAFAVPCAALAEPPHDTLAVTSSSASARTVSAEPFDAEAATAAYVATLSAPAHARSDAYFEGGYWLILWDFVVGLAVAGLLLVTPLSRRMRDFAVRMTRFPWLQTSIYAAEYVVLTTAVTLPWSAYEGYFREHQYGMSNQTLAEWLADQGKGLAIAVIFGALAVSGVYAVIRKVPRNWWLWGSGVAMVVLVLQIAIAPTYLEPVFNRFYPLPDGTLKRRILSLSRANEIPVTQVYEFDASKQTTKMSAHVSGLFGSAQISLNDNLVNRGSPEEVVAVLGHEMGHYAMNHIYKSVVLFGVLIVIGFAIVAFGFERINVGFASRLGIGGITDIAGLPLLIAIFSVYVFLLTPVFNSITRTMEAEADAFGLNAAREPDGFAQAALHLAEYRKMQPGRFEEIVFFDHPSGWDRILRAMIWKSQNMDAVDIASYDASHHPPGTPHPGP